MRSFGLTKKVAVAAAGFMMMAAAHGDVYSLATCPVSGKALGDAPVIQKVGDREVRFCCGGCPAKYEADTAKYDAEIDKAMLESQAKHYPLTNCLVADANALGDGAVKKIHDNRMVAFCCGNCEKKFDAEPAAYLSKLDEAVKAAQNESYPLENCIVAGEKLGSMGDPIEIVVANQLVKFCCAGCQKKFDANPAAYLSKLDAKEEKAAE